MEVKPGYKQTEVGAIPEDWDASHLSKLCTLIVDGTHQTPRYVTSGVPFYSVENVVGNKFKNSKCISIEEHKKISKRALPQKGDILLTRIGSLGSTKLVDWDYESSIYVSLALLRFNKSIDSSYIYSYTKSRSFRMSIEERALMNAIPVKINMNMIGNIPIPIPNIIEQREIGRAITDIDLLINSLEKLIEKKMNIKQGVMQELLTGKRRLPGFTGEWETKKLSAVAIIKKGQQLNADEFVEYGHYPVMNGGISPSGYTGCFNAEASTLIISEGGNSCGFVNYMKTRFWQGGHCYSINTDQNTLFLYYLLKNMELSIMSLRVGSGLPNIQKNRLSELNLEIPSTSEQSVIANTLFDLEKEIQSYKAILEKYCLIKLGMMQVLLTGRIRLI